MKAELAKHRGVAKIQKGCGQDPREGKHRPRPSKVRPSLCCINMLLQATHGGAAGEMTQWVKLLVIQPDDLGLILGTYLLAHNHL